MIDLLVALALVLGFVFGWNNSSLLIGNLTSSGTLSLLGAALVSAVGILLGVLFEGSDMLKSLNGTLASVPTAGLEETMAVSIVLMVLMTGVALPAPLSSAMTGAFLGVAVGFGAAVNLQSTSLVLSFWFVAPVLAAVVAFAFHRGASRLVPRLSLVGSDAFSRVGVIVSSLAVAYSLGANNVGLIAGTAVGGGQALSTLALSAAIALAAALGVVLLGRGSVSGTIGDRLVSLSPQAVIAVFAASAFTVWVGTLLAVPMSMSQCVLGGMIGAALSQRTVVINPRIAYESIATWVLVPLVAVVLGYAWVVLQ
jgi:inorganic phosphate transporter, PiT family